MRALVVWQWLGPKIALRLMRFWPPFLGAGIRIEKINDDFTSISVAMPLRFYNANLVGVHFGGSLYSMCDPFLMCILFIHIGKEYIVWDKAGEIRFVKPGRGKVRAVFDIPLTEIEAIKQRADAHGKDEPVFRINIVDAQNEVISTVKKTLYVRKKSPT